MQAAGVASVAEMRNAHPARSSMRRWARWGPEGGGFAPVIDGLVLPDARLRGGQHQRHADPDRHDRRRDDRPQPELRQGHPGQLPPGGRCGLRQLGGEGRTALSGGERCRGQCRGERARARPRARLDGDVGAAAAGEERQAGLRLPLDRIPSRDPTRRATARSTRPRSLRVRHARCFARAAVRRARPQAGGADGRLLGELRQDRQSQWHRRCRHGRPIARPTARSSRSVPRPRRGRCSPAGTFEVFRAYTEQGGRLSMF